MIVVDTETTGVDPRKHSLLSIGAVDFDNPTRTFYIECRIFPEAHVDPEALKINGFSEASLGDHLKKTDEEALVLFLAWAKEAKDHTLAGQNPSFDRDFLQAAARRYHLDWPLAERTIDLHSVCYADMLKRNVEPPLQNRRSDLKLDAILAYVGLERGAGIHNALLDAEFEAEAFSRLFFNKPLLKKFESFSLPKH